MRDTTSAAYLAAAELARLAYEATLTGAHDAAQLAATAATAYAALTT
jgi:hypothetical protein